MHWCYNSLQVTGSVKAAAALAEFRARRLPTGGPDGLAAQVGPNSSQAAVMLDQVVSVHVHMGTSTVWTTATSHLLPPCSWSPATLAVCNSPELELVGSWRPDQTNRL